MRPRPSHIAAAAACAWLVALAAVPAWCADVEGNVTNAEDGAAVDFVTVQLFGTSGAGDDVRRGVMTTSQGYYFIPDVPPGRYSVRFTRIGFDVREDSLFVVADRVYRLDVTLGVAPVEVEKIVVEADRYAGVRDVQTGFVGLEADALADLPGVVEADPVRSLQLLPGVQAASDFSSGLYVRGGGPDQTLVLLDKVTVYNPTHAFGFFSTFNADAVGDVNLYKGAYPSDYGGRLGAVLDMRSRRGNAAGVSGRGGVSTIASRLALNGPVAGGTWLASARRTHLDPFLDAIRTEDNEIPAYYFYDVNGRLSLPLAGGTLDVTGYTGRDDLRFDLERDTFIDRDWGNALVAAAWRRPVGDDVVAEVRASGSRYESESSLRIFGTPIALTNRIRELGGAAELRWTPDDAMQVGAGLTASRYRIQYFQSFNTERQIDYSRRPAEGAAFADARWMPTPATVLRGGVRVRYLEDGGRVLAEPRWSASRALDDRWRVKLGGGIYYQYLQLVSTEGFSAADFYVPIDDSADPARAWQTVAGVEYRPASAWELSLEGYYTDLADLVQFNTTVSGDNPFTDAADLFYTGGTGYASGAELFLHKRRGDFTGWIGYTLGWTRRTFPALNQGRAFPPKYDRRHDLDIVAQYRRGRWTWGANFVLASGQAFTPAAAVYGLRNPATRTFGDPRLLPAARNSARLLPYHRLDLSVTRRFTWLGRSMEGYLQVFNAYSRRNEWFVQYNLDDATAEPDVVRMLPVIPSLGINVEF